MSRKHPLALLRQFLPEFLQPLSARIAGIDVAVVVHAEALESAGVFVSLDESGDLAVLGAADPDALFEAGVGLVGRLRVCDIDAVILVDPHAARPAELLPLGDEVAVRVEDLQAVVWAVRGAQTSRGVERGPLRAAAPAPAPAFPAPPPYGTSRPGGHVRAGSGAVAPP